MCFVSFLQRYGMFTNKICITLGISAFCYIRPNTGSTFQNLFAHDIFLSICCQMLI